MNCELVERSSLRLNCAIGLSDTTLGQVPCHCQQVIGRMIDKKLCHLGDFLKRHEPRNFEIWSYVKRKEMPGQRIY